MVKIIYMDKKNIKLYSTNEVKTAHGTLDVTIVKETDVIDLGITKIEVVHAEHGYIPPMKTGAKGVMVGYRSNG